MTFVIRAMIAPKKNQSQGHVDGLPIILAQHKKTQRHYHDCREYPQYIVEDETHLFQAETGTDLWLVESHHDRSVYVYDRHSHLAGLIYHLLALFHVRRHVEVLIFESVGLEKAFGHIAIHAGWSGIDDDIFHVDMIAYVM